MTSALVVIVLVLHGSVHAEIPAGGYKELECVELLFDLIAAIADQNSGYVETLGRIGAMDEAAAASAFDSLALRNRDNPVLAKKIDSLLASDTYQIYFRRFRNVNPEIFRTAFSNLPYRDVPTPGGVSSCFFELSRNVDAVRDWMRDTVRRIDIPRCLAHAERWLPDGDYQPLTIYFIYDSNAGSFTAEGKAFFNLQSMIGEFSYGGGLSQQLSNIDIVSMEAVIAHEMHHIYARPMLYPVGLFFSSWQDRWLNKIVREIVSEGVAGQCNPCTGFKKDIWEDPEILARLIRSLNETCLAMYDGTLDEKAVGAWYSATYQESARELLKDYVLKQYDEQQAEGLLRQYMPVRPDLVHTLGWWMVSCITSRQTDRDAAVSLLADPAALFSAYNASVSPERVPLRIDDRVIARLRALGGSAHPQERN